MNFTSGRRPFFFFWKMPSLSERFGWIKMGLILFGLLLKCGEISSCILVEVFDVLPAALFFHLIFLSIYSNLFIFTFGQRGLHYLLLIFAASTRLTCSATLTGLMDIMFALPKFRWLSLNLIQVVIARTLTPTPPMWVKIRLVVKGTVYLGLESM